MQQRHVTVKSLPIVRKFFFQDRGGVTSNNPSNNIVPETWSNDQLTRYLIWYKSLSQLKQHVEHTALKC